MIWTKTQAQHTYTTTWSVRKRNGRWYVYHNDTQLPGAYRMAQSAKARAESLMGEEAAA